MTERDKIKRDTEDRQTNRQKEKEKRLRER